MVGTAAAGLGLSTYQMYQGNKQAKEASNNLKNYKRNDLTNAYENTQISTVASDYAKDRNDQTSADMVEASRNGGIRAIFGGIPKIQSFNNQANQEGMQNLDNQIQNRQQNIANDNIRIRDVREDRDYQNIGGMSSQQQAGEQNKWAGMMSFANNAMDLGKSVDWDGKKGKGTSYNERIAAASSKY